MAAPSPSFIVSNPPALNATRRKWPFNVLPFQAQWLLDFGGLQNGNKPVTTEQNPPNQFRHED